MTAKRPEPPRKPTERQRAAWNRYVRREEQRVFARAKAHGIDLRHGTLGNGRKVPIFDRSLAEAAGLPDYIGDVNQVSDTYRQRHGITGDRPIVVERGLLAVLPPRPSPEELKAGVVTPAARLGRLGGLVRSKKKAAAARVNGIKGGRPPLHDSKCDAVPEAERTPACRRARRRQAAKMTFVGLPPGGRRTTGKS